MHRPDVGAKRAEARVLEDVARIVGYMTIPLSKDEPRHQVPIIEPIAEYQHHCDFDKSVHAAGLQWYVRPAMSTDGPGVQPGVGIVAVTHLDDVGALRTVFPTVELHSLVQEGDS